MLGKVPISNLVLVALFGFICLHTPLYFALAVAFYCLIWVVERLYHILIALARILFFAFVAFLFLQSLSGYLPPEVPTAGRRDDLWLRRAEVLMLQSLLRY